MFFIKCVRKIDRKKTVKFAASKSLQALFPVDLNFTFFLLTIYDLENVFVKLKNDGI